MAEQDMIRAVQAALDDRGISDTIEQVGQFNPRGTSGSLFAGGMIGSEVGGAFGHVGEAIGLGAGALGGIEASSSSRGLPKQMFVGASESMIYGFKMRSRKKEPHDLVFQVPRDAIDVNVHGRVNVRVLELVEKETGAKIELEGNRIPITHAHDLIKYLAGETAADASDAQAKAEGEVLEESG